MILPVAVVTACPRVCRSRRRLIAATVALAALFTSSEASGEICIDMNLRFDERDSAGALVESMASEAASIWESYGVRLQWRATPGPARCAWTQASFDVLLDPPSPGARSSKVILGSTYLAPGVIDHVPIHVDRRATERVLGSLAFDQLARLLGRAGVDPSDVGRAMGRVLAHEIGHVLLATRDHQPGGLMRAAFIAADLLTPDRHSYRLSPAEVTRLRQRERALSHSSGDSAGAPLPARR